MVKRKTPLPKIETGAELVAYWRREDVIGMRPDIKNSQKHARKIRKKAERRNRKRRID